MMKIKLLIIMVLLLLPFSTQAAIYYVDGKSGLDTNPGTIGNPWKTIHKANTTLVAGDKVYIMGGTYAVGAYPGLTEGIIPRNSGTSGKPITYTVYEDEVVNLVGQADVGVYSMGIWINGKSYIKVDGKSLGQLNLSKMVGFIYIGPKSGPASIGDSSYNEISYVYAYNGYDSESWSYVWQGNAVWQRAFYNHIHHCKFEKYGWLGTGASENDGNLFDLGVESASTADEKTYYNVIENNEFSHGGHATFGFFGDHNIVRNNYFHNEGWYEIDGDNYGYRNIIGNGRSGYVGYSLFEGNRIGHAAPNYTYDGKNGNWGGTGMKLCTPYNIVRYNSIFNNSSDGLSLGTYSGSNKANGDHNYIYNNTFFKNGYYLKLPYVEYKYCDTFVFGYIGDSDYAVMDGSVVKNNLFYNNSNTTNSVDVWNAGNEGSLKNSALTYVLHPDYGNVTIANNFNGNINSYSNTDPLFINESLRSPASWTLPDLNLSAESPAIDKGTYLTQANNSGSYSITLIVDNARYFQDGNFGKGTLAWPSSVKMYADWIAIDTAENIVQIKSIDYNTNTITLVSPMTWNDNAKVWLYKKSDGERVLCGNNPDMGAYESASEAGVLGIPPKPPSNPRIY